MTIRPYILCGRSALESTKVSVQEILYEWAVEWNLSDAAISLSAVEPLHGLNENEAAEPVLAVTAGDEKWVLLVQDRELFEELGCLLLRDSRVRPRQGAIEDSIVADVVSETLTDLLLRIAGNGPARRDFKSTLGRHIDPDAAGTGIVRLYLQVGGIGMCAFISGEAARALCGPESAVADGHGGELVPALEALGRQQVPVRVALGNAELTLDALGSLQVGDVIRLDVSLSEPLMVDFAQSGNACRGFLGQKDGRLAVQLDLLARV